MKDKSKNMEKPIVCMVVRNGVTRDARVMKEALSLAKAGFSVKVVGIQQPDFEAPQLNIQPNLEVFRVDSTKMRAKKNTGFFSPFQKIYEYRQETKRIFDQVISIKPDILHCHDILTIGVGIKAKKQLNCKLIYDAHEIYEECVGVDWRRKLLYLYLYSQTQNHFDAFISINQSICDYYKKAHPNFPDATLIMNATKIHDNIAYDGRLHNKAELPLSQQILLYHGGISKMRGLIDLAHSAEYLPDNWTLVFMGWGPLENKIAAIAHEINQKINRRKLVIIPPAEQQDLALWTAGATIGVIPYEAHGLNHQFCTPNKLWEYPSAGVPALVSPRDEMKRLIEKYQYGWVMQEPMTPKQIAEFIASLTPEQIAQAKNNCTHFMNENHWGVYEQNLFDLYKRLA